jgi:putative transposase
VTKDYQKKTARTSAIVESPVPVVPDVVSVAMNEIAADVGEGLLAIAVGAGLQVMAAMMAADVEALCGRRGQHDPDRAATRHGGEDGSVILGGRRLPMRRPRVRAADGSVELPIASYQTFSRSEMLGRKAMEQMLAGLSTRRYQVGLEPVGEQISTESTSTSKSAISRRFVKATEQALTDLMSADLSGLDLVAFMVDGVHFADHVCLVALGITIDGTKVPLAIEEGSTENATLVTTLIVGLRERGLDVTRPILAVLDGSKALSRAVKDVFDHPVIARCQLHKIRNVRDRLPEKLRTVVERRIRTAYHADSALAAQAELEALAADLDIEASRERRAACARA